MCNNNCDGSWVTSGGSRFRWVSGSWVTPLDPLPTLVQVGASRLWWKRFVEKVIFEPVARRCADKRIREVQ